MPGRHLPTQASVEYPPGEGGAIHGTVINLKDNLANFVGLLNSTDEIRLCSFRTLSMMALKRTTGIHQVRKVRKLQNTSAYSARINPYYGEF